MSAHSADFLVEIGTEELPPKALRDLEQAFARHMQEAISAAGLSFTALRSFATPRRLAVLIESLELGAAVRRIEKRGPPLAVSFDTNGAPTRAAMAFAEGCGVAVTELERLETPKGAWLFYRGASAGRMTRDLLPDIVTAALAALPIPRRMRWGAGDAEFVRPVHWVLMLLGSTVIPCTILGKAAGQQTRGHRFHAPDPLTISTPADYEPALLNTGWIVPDFEARRARVRQLAEEGARSVGGVAVINASLLDEVTALVEWPVPVVGHFSEQFLGLPEEVLTATLQDHQRYFPVRNATGGLMAHFVTISNLESRDPDQVRHGNERVIRPRLADAEFFWSQDIRVPLGSRVEQLRTVIYQHGLGSLHDKAARLARIGCQLAPALGCDTSQMQRAAMLAKTDLLTQMVGEFPELQGRMGCHYARRDGEPEEVARALGEQYLPRHAGDILPTSRLGMLLAVTDRVDTLAGIFALGKRPSGNKDPFGLRRAALGLLRILIEQRLDVDLPELLRQAVTAQPVTVTDQAAVAVALYDFLADRLRSYYLEGLAPGLEAGAISTEMFEAVRVRRPASPLDFHERLLAVRAFMGLPAAGSLAVANKRIANILRTAAGETPDRVDPALFESREEQQLFAAVDRAATAHGERLGRRDYQAVLRSLAELKAPVDGFFEAVLVMTDDVPRRLNRLAQLRQLRDMFLDVADLSCMPTP